MKTIIAVIGAAALTLGLTSCSSTGAASNQQSSDMGSRSPTVPSGLSGSDHGYGGGYGGGMGGMGGSR